MDVVLLGRNELPLATSYGYSKASVSSLGKVVTTAELVNTDGNGLSVDTTTNALTMIDIHASELHMGNSFYIKGYLELDDTDTFFMKLVTPATKDMHFSFTINSTGQTVTSFDEGATGGMTGGTAVTPLNRNRNSLNASTAVFTSGTTVADSYTTRLVADKWGAGSKKTPIGGSETNVSEYILKNSTTYQRSFLSNVNGNIIQFEASWTEIEDKT